MDHEPHIVARLSIQTALTTHVTPSLRSVSLAVSPDGEDLTLQFVYDATATEDELELPSIVATEVSAGWYNPAAVYERVLTVAAPTKMEHLDWIVYHRCEDDWVTGRA